MLHQILDVHTKTGHPRRRKQGADIDSLPPHCIGTCKRMFCHGFWGVSIDMRKPLDCRKVPRSVSDLPMSQVTSMSRENSHVKGIQDRPEDGALICLLFARKAGRLSSPSSGRSGHGFSNSGDFLHPRPCFCLASASSNSRVQALITRYCNSIMIADQRRALLHRVHEQTIQGKSKS